jgi:hypothetical protein
VSADTVIPLVGSTDTHWKGETTLPSFSMNTRCSATCQLGSSTSAPKSLGAQCQSWTAGVPRVLAACECQRLRREDEVRTFAAAGTSLR